MYYQLESERIGKKFSKRVMIDGVVYNSLLQASNALNISRASMTKYAKLGEFRGKKISFVDLDKNYKLNDTKESTDAPYAREGIFF